VYTGEFPEFVDYVKLNEDIILHLMEYQYWEEGSDNGAGVRVVATELHELLFPRFRPDSPLEIKPVSKVVEMDTDFSGAEDFEEPVVVKRIPIEKQEVKMDIDDLLDFSKFVPKPAPKSERNVSVPPTLIAPRPMVVDRRSSVPSIQDKPKPKVEKRSSIVDHKKKSVEELIANMPRVKKPIKNDDTMVKVMDGSLADGIVRLRASLGLEAPVFPDKVVEPEPEPEFVFVPEPEVKAPEVVVIREMPEIMHDEEAKVEKKVEKKVEPENMTKAQNMAKFFEKKAEDKGASTHVSSNIGDDLVLLVGLKPRHLGPVKQYDD